MPKKTEPITVKSVLRTLLVQRAHIDEAGIIFWSEYKDGHYFSTGFKLPEGMLENLKINGYVDLNRAGNYRITGKGIDAYAERD